MNPSRKFSVGFGLARMHHVFSPARRERLLLGALDAGCSHLDVAPLYGDGLAEAEIGRVLSGRRDQITIATKFGIPCTDVGARHPLAYYLRKGLEKMRLPRYRRDLSRREFSAASARESLHASLKRMRTDRIDYFLVHEPLDPAALQREPDLVDALEREKQAGKVRHYGVAAPTRLMLDALPWGGLCGDVLQFELSPDSPELLEHAGSRVALFGYGLYRHLQAGCSSRRIDLRDALRWFHGFMPGAVPLVSTCREDEIGRLSRAIAALT